MKDRIEILRFWVMPAAFLAMSLWLAVSAALKPKITDLIEVGQIKVVALENPVRRDGCIVAGREKERIAPGDMRYVKAEITFLQDLTERYRTWLRAIDRGRNIYDDREWSGRFKIAGGNTYCPYEALNWWAGRQVGPLDPGVYRLVTEYELTTPDGRVVVESFASAPFIVEEDHD